MSKSIECIIELKSGNNTLKIVGHLVRCKDCAYWQDDWELSSKDPHWHYCSMNDTNFSADEYCSRGERKDAGNRWEDNDEKSMQGMR